MSDVWKHAPDELTPNDLLVLLIIADSANDTTRFTWESVSTMQRKSRLSERKVYDALAKFDRLGIVEHVREEDIPGIAKLYKSVVRIITEPGQWQSTPVPDLLVVPTPELVEVENRVTLQPVHPAASAPNSVVLKNLRSSSNSKSFALPVMQNPAGSAVVTPDELTDSVEDILASYQPTRQAYVDDADPSTVRAASLRKSRKASPAPDTGTGLVGYFQNKISKELEGWAATGWSIGLQPVNYSKMAHSLVEWKRGGVSADEIRAMMDVYATEAAFRTTGAVPWVDFLAKRGKLAARVAALAKNGRMEDHRDDPNYWT